MSRCQEDIAFRVIVGDDIPDFRTINDFRKVNLEHMKTLFVQAPSVSARGTAKLGCMALGRANALRHKAMSYERVQAEEQRLQQEIADLLTAAQQADEGDGFDERHGDELPAELKRRKTRMARKVPRFSTEELAKLKSLLKSL